ncbi:hypothetical protein OG800_16090 [Streptomyces sp. NBC_00445]|uniref:hypothetical protein n=1 Tax=Streptomyces sp. NBC_00445 TaxID=2975745 RepID=UPI002E1A3B70
MVRLPLEERRRRAALLLEAPAHLSGGAKQALHCADRVPSLLVLVPCKGGITPLANVMGTQVVKACSANMPLAPVEHRGQDVLNECVTRWRVDYTHMTSCHICLPDTFLHSKLVILPC